MKILYLSYFATPETFEKICDAGLEPSQARQNYDIAFISNLLANQEVSKDVSIVAYLPFNKQLGEVQNEDVYMGKKIHYVWTRRNSISDIFKAMRRVKRLVRDWLKHTAGEDRIILTYAANPILLHPIMPLVKKTKIVTICSEVPKYRNMTEGNKMLNAIKKKVFSYYNEKMSGYIYMSRHMNEVCNKKQAPWIVIEGMADIYPLENSCSYSKECVFYAGGLHIENGIDILLDAMVKLNEKREIKVLLQLCGVGNAVDKIKQYANSCEFIQYLGVLPNNKIRELEREATLLINPRKADHLLTRYSFPSKTFEYFTSGTPAVLTKLEGIPDEYYQYCYTCDSTDAETLARDLDAVLDIPFETRLQKAQAAFRFVKENKSAAKQTERIVNFLKEIK